MMSNMIFVPGSLAVFNENKRVQVYHLFSSRITLKKRRDKKTLQHLQIIINQTISIPPQSQIIVAHLNHNGIVPFICLISWAYDPRTDHPIFVSKQGKDLCVYKIFTLNGCQVIGYTFWPGSFGDC